MNEKRASQIVDSITAAAGMSHEAFYGKVRRIMQKIAMKYGGRASGVEASGITEDNVSWSASIERSNASNGETFGELKLTVNKGGSPVTYRSFFDWDKVFEKAGIPQVAAGVRWAAQLDDSPRDIAVDVATRIVEQGMSPDKAFEAVGYGWIYKHTRQTDMPKGWWFLPVGSMAKALMVAIERANKRFQTSGRVASEINWVEPAGVDVNRWNEWIATVAPELEKVLKPVRILKITPNSPAHRSYLEVEKNGRKFNLSISDIQSLKAVAELEACFRKFDRVVKAYESLDGQTDPFYSSVFGAVKAYFGDGQGKHVAYNIICDWVSQSGRRIWSSDRRAAVGRLPHNVRPETVFAFKTGSYTNAALDMGRYEETRYLDVAICNEEGQITGWYEFRRDGEVPKEEAKGKIFGPVGSVSEYSIESWVSSLFRSFNITEPNGWAGPNLGHGSFRFSQLFKMMNEGTVSNMGGELTWEEQVVLASFGYKPSYAGIKDYRKYEAMRSTNISEPEYDAARASLKSKGLIRPNNALSPVGQEARKKVPDLWRLKSMPKTASGGDEFTVEEYVGKVDSQEAMKWVVNLVRNYVNGIGGDILPQVLKAADEIGFDRRGVEQRWRHVQDADLRRKEGMYFLLTGERHPHSTGYVWASSRVGSFDDEDFDTVECPACHSEQAKSACLMGSLGNREHYRCVYCGMGWSKVVPREELIASTIARDFTAINKFEKQDVVLINKDGKDIETEIIKVHFNGGKYQYTVDAEDEPVPESKLRAAGCRK